MNALPCRKALGRAATLVALLATAACLDDRPVAPESGDEGLPVRLGLQANVVGAAAGQTVRIRAFYRRVDGTNITLESTPTEVAVTPGEPQTVAVQVRVNRCLADSQRQGATAGACEIGIELTLLDEAGTVIDQQSTPPSQAATPGTSVTIGQPITLADLAEVTIAAVPALRVGDSRTLTATATDANGNSVSRSYAWTTDNPGVLTVNATTGAATAVAPGSARVTAATGLKSGAATVRVIRRVASVTLTPDPVPDLRAAATLSFTASPKDESGADAGDLADRTITWTATNPAGSTRTASVAPNGIVTGVYPGDADITVSIDGVTRTARVRVTAGGIRVTPSSPQLLVGATQSLQATVIDANGATLAGVPVSWGSSNTAVATVDANGVLTAVAAGQATITVTGGGVSTTVPVTVGTLSLTVTPNGVTVLAGNTVQLTAAGALGTVAWQTNNASIATVSATGLVTARYPGRVTITATVATPNGTQRGTATFDVNVASLEIDPSKATIAEGDTLRFTATAFDSKGIVLVGVPVGFISSDSYSAPIRSDGLVYGASPTEVPITITAFAGGQQASASLTILPYYTYYTAPHPDTRDVRAPARTTGTRPDK